MFFKFFGFSFGKVKDKNDMLGFLIANQKPNGDVPSKIILDKLNDICLDNFSANQLIKSLSDAHYIIYAMDVITVTKLGENNYNSPYKRFALWLAKLLVLTVKNVVLYVGGILSGILVAYFTNMFVK